MSAEAQRGVPSEGSAKSRASTRSRSRKEAPRVEGSIRAVDRALDVLEAIARDPNGVTVLEIARRVELPLSTVYRVIETLRRRHYVSELASGSRVGIGPALLEVSSAYRAPRDLKEIAHPVMSSLAALVRETTNLAIQESGVAVYLHQVEAPEMLMRMFMQTGVRAPCHCSGVGKVLLAWATEREAERLLETVDFAAYTSRTITNLPQLQHELERIRKLGYALDDEEREIGVRCVAVPVFSASRRLVAGLSVSGPTSRVTLDRVPDLVEQVSAAAAAIGDQLS
jgi:IclR family acetate operon transcriptional repressor